MSFIRTLRILSLFVSVAFVGCDTSTTINESTNTSQPLVQNNLFTDNTILSSSNDCFKISTTWKKQVKANQYFPFTITFIESCIPLKDILFIKADADMPSHNHGMNSLPRTIPFNKKHAAIKSEPSDTYQVIGMLLHMTGEWRVTLEINYRTEHGKRMELIEFYDTL